MLPVLVGSYLACRPLTKTSGVEDVTRYISQDTDAVQADPKYYAPLVLECSTLAWGPNAKTAITNRWHYLWFFGVVYKLPITRQHDWARQVIQRNRGRTFAQPGVLVFTIEAPGQSCSHRANVLDWQRSRVCFSGSPMKRDGRTKGCREE